MLLSGDGGTSASCSGQLQGRPPAVARDPTLPLRGQQQWVQSSSSLIALTSSPASSFHPEGPAGSRWAQPQHRGGRKRPRERQSRMGSVQRSGPWEE